MNMRTVFALALTAAALVSCSSKKLYNAMSEDIGISYSTTSAVYTQGLPAPSNTPIVAGTVGSWSISPALPAGLAIDSSTGVISGTPTALQSATLYTVTAKGAHGSLTANVSITVNLAPPTALTYATTSCVFTKDIYIVDNTPTVTGTATTWTINPALPSGLTLDASTGVISGKPTALQASTPYTITAANGYGSTTTAISIAVSIAPPTALQYAKTAAIYTSGVIIQDNTPTVTGTIVSWSISPALPSVLLFNTSSGVISGTPSLDQAAAQYTVTATNTTGSATAVLSIGVDSNAPSALSYATTACVYTKDAVIISNIPSVTGTVTSWSAGSLPAGLAIDTSTGIISGTPTTVQSAAQYLITATNSHGSATAAITITVNKAAPLGLSYSQPTAAYTRNAVILNNTPTITGTATSWSVSPSLPTGLTLNTTTGVISGSPEETQSAVTYTITAGNTYGSTTAAVSIAVSPSAPTGLTYSLPAAVYTVNAMIQSNRPSVSGTATSWSVNPALPSGLVLDTATGVISGAPSSSQSATSYLITAANAYGSTSASVSITVNISAPAGLSYSTMAAVYKEGYAITGNIPTVTGTVTSWSVSPALPTGLAIDGSGVITGTPSGIQSSTSYTITATNAAGNTTTTITIQIKPVYLYVCNQNDDTVTYLSAITGTTLGTYSTGASPVSIAVNPADNIIYVLNQTDGTISYLNAENGTVLGTYSTGLLPAQLAFNPIANILYVSNRTGNSVMFLHPTTGALLGTYAITSPSCLAVDPNANILYVENGTSSVSYLDATTGLPLYTTMLASTFTTGIQAQTLTVDSTAGVLNVLDWTSVLSPTIITRLNSSTGNSLSTFTAGSWTGPSTFNMGINPEKNLIYVSNYNGDAVAFINSATGVNSGPYATGSYPLVLTVNPKINTLYIACKNNLAGSIAGTVQFLNATTGDDLGITGTTGKYPSAIGINP